MKNPIEILEEEVRKFKSAVLHSDIAFNKGQIDTILNAKHHYNNSKRIIQFRKAINILKKHGKKTK